MKNYIFDLDNTLYKYNNGLFDAQLVKMSEFIMHKLNISDIEKANFIRDELYYECGSTMLGMMRYHNIDYKEFLSYMDSVDISHFKPNEELNCFLRNLQQQQKSLYIFTNASNFHTERVTKQFGLDVFFEDVLTLEDTHLVPKPKFKYFEIAQQKFNIDYTDAIFFEDSSHNLVTAKHLGMTTVLIHADDEKSELNFQENEEIDFYVKDVESFFRREYLSTRKTK